MGTVLITVDALRADHLRQYGYDRDTMPCLDRLTADGTRFTSAFANGPYTRVSVPSFHTSRYLAYKDIETLPTISSALGSAGIKTACIGTQTGFKNTVGELHFDEYVDLGRDAYHERSTRNPRQRLTEPFHRAARTVGPHVREVSGELFDRLQRLYDSVVPGFGLEFLGYTSAADVTDRAIEWLEANADEEFFLWLHYMEGHRPYGVHDDNPAYTDPIDESSIRSLMKTAGMRPDEVTVRQHRRLEDLYDSDLRYCSAQLDRLFDWLESAGVWDRTDVIFTSDHGEEFYDHGLYFHRNLPYDELLHVPLIAKGPDSGGDTVSEQRELLDLAPTICRWNGVSPPESFRGRSLYEGSSRRVIAVGAQQSASQVVAGRWDGWKYISVGGDERLFDLQSDGRERQAVMDANGIRYRFRTSIPDALYEGAPEQLRQPTDRVDQEQLEALGYLEVDET